ncbi:MAG: two-component sensor histidine kinase [Bacteroidetes bacterium]|nr:two-component sensor histidine kinase [Bacteroidota bacterium]
MRFFSSVHLLLLGYIIAALIFWYISLQKQNDRILAQEVVLLETRIDSAAQPDVYNRDMGILIKSHHMRTSQYLGEGTTFLVVILIGASVVWSSFRRSLRLSRQQNNFMLSVTHELKSPLAAMKLNLQTLERHHLDEEKTKQLIDRCIKESNRLNDLCNNMLFASQIEGRQYVPAKEKFDLSELVEDAVTDYAHRYPRVFEEDILEGCKLAGDKVLLHMAVNNLLENAVKYAPADKPITITLTRKQDNAIIQVIDQGPGISNEEKKKVFNKFYRIGSEESRKSKGTGLGLYLTCKIISQHKGKISVKDNTPTGAIFEICLPLS